MNWVATGAVGEVLGAIAVVATLLYLTREVRQNARSLSISARRYHRWIEDIRQGL